MALDPVTLKQTLDEGSDLELLSMCNGLLEVNSSFNGLASTGVARESKPHSAYLIDSVGACEVVRDTLMERITAGDRSYRVTLALTQTYYAIIKLLRAYLNVLSSISLCNEVGFDKEYAAIQVSKEAAQYNLNVLYFMESD